MTKREPYSTIDQVLIDDNGYWRYKRDEYVLSDGLNHAEYFYADSHGSTIIIPMTSAESVLMVKQFRYLNKKLSIEFPGGGLQFGMTPEENAKKELLEETGMKADTFLHIGSFNPCNGITNELCSVYIAKDLRFVGQNTDATEEIEIMEVTLDECRSMIQAGTIWDGMTLASWTLYQIAQSKDFSP